MRILGHGVDLVQVERIERMLRDHADRFVDRCFTAEERAYCAPMKRAAEHFAARFAAKEAVLKALGKGLSDGIGWVEIEVRRSPEGRPSIHLIGRAREIADEQGITSIFVSLSHTDSHAIASVIAVGDAEAP